MFDSSDERSWLLALEDTLVRARDVLSALMRAVTAGDAVIAVATSGGLRQCLLEASGMLRAAVAERWLPESSLGDSLLRATDGILTLLRGEPHIMPPATKAPAPDVSLLLEESRHREISKYDSRGRCLDDVSLSHVHLTQSRFITSMRGSTFAHATVDHCDFTYARLDGSTWERVAIRGSSLRFCSLVDAGFESVVFRRCDLRDADLGATGTSLAPFDVTFIECDLRGASWHGRDVARTMQIGCVSDAAVEPHAEPTPLAARSKGFS
jgi:uncharacterized protein YjbI with pentapeptide repeats